MAKNPYTVLGVAENATDDEIRNAYRKLAKRYHPDLNPNDSYAAQKMNEINVAYDQIKTAEKRAEYRAESARQAYRQSPYGTYSNPWGTYYGTGQSYYGTGSGNRQENNEPPFGWDSVFSQGAKQKRPHNVRFRIFRMIGMFFLLSFLFSLARCICAPFLFYAYGTGGTAYRAGTEPTVISMTKYDPLQ